MRTLFKACLLLGLMLSSVMAATAVSAQDGCDIEGAGGPDQLNGGSGSQVICGRGGPDTLNGGSGHDTVYGNGGGDHVKGGSGHDDLYGNGGGDELKGQSGNDTLTGGNGADYFRGGSGRDTATDFECGVDEHDGTVEEGVDCEGGGGGGNLPDDCSADREPGFDVTCSWPTGDEGNAFIDANCEDTADIDPFECTLNGVPYSCTTGPEFFLFCNEAP